MTSFNAWSQPWLPVLHSNGTSDTLSLRDTFCQAHNLTGLGAGLTPLDLDSLYRFLPSVGAVISRHIQDDESDDDWAFPEYAVDLFGDTFIHRFELFGPEPFLQRWDRTQADIATLTDPKRGLDAVLAPLEGLHPHEPGGSSSRWQIRRDGRDVTDLAVLTLLLVTAWFQTKNGNGQDPWGGRTLKGSANTWHTNPLAIYYTDPTNLARTINANTPAAWLEDHRTDLPLFLNHRELPTDFATATKSSVTRFTYAKTLPLIYLEAGKPVGFVLGADATIEIPVLGKDYKESLGLVHESDHSRLYIAQRNKKGTITGYKPRGSFGGRLSTTEGFTRWFRADNGISGALRDWKAVTRVIQISNREMSDWTVSIFSETTDGKGSRSWAAWDEMPAQFAAAEGELLSNIQHLLAYANTCRYQFLVAGRIATGESKDVPAIVTGQAAFYTAIQPLITQLAVETNAGVTGDLQEYAAKITKAAVEQFDATTAALLTPARVADVARARSRYRRNVFGALKKDPPPTTNKEPV